LAWIEEIEPSRLFPFANRIDDSSETGVGSSPVPTTSVTTADRIERQRIDVRSTPAKQVAREQGSEHRLTWRAWLTQVRWRGK
jgi:hypothetical protein